MGRRVIFWLAKMTSKNVTYLLPGRKMVPHQLFSSPHLYIRIVLAIKKGKIGLWDFSQHIVCGETVHFDFFSRQKPKLWNNESNIHFISIQTSRFQIIRQLEHIYRAFPVPIESEQHVLSTHSATHWPLPQIYHRHCHQTQSYPASTICSDLKATIFSFKGEGGR